MKLVKFYYKGIPLHEYCKNNNLNYYNIYKLLSELKKSNWYEERKSNLSKDDLIEFVVDNDNALITLLSNDELMSFLKNNNISEENIIDSIKDVRRNKTYTKASVNSVLSKAISIANYKLKCKKIFEKIEKGNLKDKDIKISCYYLGINPAKVKELSKVMTLGQAMLLIKYFGKSEYKILTDSELKRIENMKNGDIDDIDITDLVKLYKSNILDTREKILEIKEKELRLFLKNYEFCNNVDISGDLLDDLVNEYSYHILKILKEDCYHGAEMLLEKINDKDDIVKIIEKEVEYENMVTLKPINQLIIENENNNERFSDKTNSLLNCLNIAERTFIVKKFRGNYTSQELAQIYNVDVEKIIETEERVLEKLWCKSKSKGKR